MSDSKLTDINTMTKDSLIKNPIVKDTIIKDTIVKDTIIQFPTKIWRKNYGNSIPFAFLEPGTLVQYEYRDRYYPSVVLKKSWKGQLVCYDLRLLIGENKVVKEVLGSELKEFDDVPKLWNGVEPIEQGMFLDCKDKNGTWYIAFVKSVYHNENKGNKQNTNDNQKLIISVHFLDFTSEHDETISVNINEIYENFAVYGSYCKFNNNFPSGLKELYYIPKIGDMIECKMQDNTWEKRTIVSLFKFQDQVLYIYTNKQEWLENEQCTLININTSYAHTHDSACVATFRNIQVNDDNNLKSKVQELDIIYQIIMIVGLVIIGLFIVLFGILFSRTTTINTSLIEYQGMLNNYTNTLNVTDTEIRLISNQLNSIINSPYINQYVVQIAYLVFNFITSGIFIAPCLLIILQRIAKKIF